MGAQGCGEHNGGDLTDGEFLPVKASALLGFTDVWGRVDCGPPLSATVGV